MNCLTFLRRSLLLLVAISVAGLSGCGSDTETASSGGGGELAVAASGNVEWNLDESGLAIHGYDPVSYRSEEGPQLGLADFENEWGGAKWRFATKANLDEFVANPEKYVPANGGYCTFGVVLSKKFDGDPQVWSLQDEQVYLFLNEDVKEKFFQDSDGNLSKVAANWPTIKSKAPADLE